jgi:acyl dehydratase
MRIEVGQTATYEKTFTVGDVQRFAELSGDMGIHHMQPDSAGRIMVQGLLTATVPTKLGGDLNYIARQMTIEFVRPVFVGDTIRCEAMVMNVETGRERIDVGIRFTCYNQHGKEVLLGTTQGVVRL